jgi:hypothetical protein
LAESLSLKKIQFKAGARPDAPPLAITGGHAIVLVGPNNSGKSLALRELEAWATGQEAMRKIIAGVEVKWPTYDESLALLKEIEAPSPTPLPPEHVYVSAVRPGKDPLQYPVSLSGPAQWVQEPAQHSEALRSTFLQPYTTRLDGRGRFALADPQPSGDLQQPARNHLWRLLQDDQRREQVRELVAQAFGFHFFIDGTGMNEFRVRLAPTAPPEEIDELSFGPAARDFASKAPLLGDLGDGVQAYVGLISAVLGLTARHLLIDEPEAFLHPVLSRRLGSNLVALAEERAGTLVVATHSPNFLMGCIEESPETTVVRLTFEKEVPTARVLPSDQLSELLHDPLLRSTRALEGLFHRAVIITESDNDRAFYGEINRRLVLDDRGIPDALFINAQNWQTTARLMGPLRAIGIPASVIIDFDSLASPDSWSSYFKAMGLDDEKRGQLGQQKSKCSGYLKTVGKRAYKAKGIDALPPAEAEEVDQFLGALRRHGIFVVPVGEVENWLADLEVPGAKTQWAVKMLERLGSDTTSDEWVAPGDGDVWGFLDSIGAWVGDPDRRGIP